MNSSAVFSIPYTQLVHWSSSIQNVSIHYTAHYDNIIRQLISARDPSACPDPCSLPSYKYSLLVRSKIRLDDGTGVRGDTGPEVGTLLSDRSVDGRTLHLTLGVDNDTGVVLKVEEDTIPSPPGLPLSTDNSGHDLLTKLRLTLLDGSHNHVTGSGSRESVKSGTKANNGDNVEVLGTRVVSAVHDGTDGETEGHAELGTGGSG